MLNVLMCEVTSVSDSLRPYGLSLAMLLCPWDSPGKNSGVGCHSLLQEIVGRGDRAKDDGDWEPPTGKVP